MAVRGGRTRAPDPRTRLARAPARAPLSDGRTGASKVGRPGPGAPAGPGPSRRVCARSRCGAAVFGRRSRSQTLPVRTCRPVPPHPPGPAGAARASRGAPGRPPSVSARSSPRPATPFTAQPLQSVQCARGRASPRFGVRPGPSSGRGRARDSSGVGGVAAGRPAATCSERALSAPHRQGASSRSLPQARSPGTGSPARPPGAVQSSPGPRIVFSGFEEMRRPRLQ